MTGETKSKNWAKSLGKALWNGREKAEQVWGNSKKFSSETAQWSNALLATDISKSISSFLASEFNKNSNIYDSAIDSVYNATKVGGSQTHHIVDGSHSLWGAWNAAKDALPDDSLRQELWGTINHLSRDAMSSSGINPLFQIKPENYEALKESLSSVGISRSWTNDIMTFNGPELIGSTIGTIAVIYNWKQKDVDQFIEMASSFGVAAVFSANPLLAMVTVISLARGIYQKKNGGVSNSTLKSALQGGVPTTILSMTSILIGGPIWIGIIIGIVLAHRSHKYLKDGGEQLPTELNSILEKAIEQDLKKSIKSRKLLINKKISESDELLRENPERATEIHTSVIRGIASQHMKELTEDVENK